MVNQRAFGHGAERKVATRMRDLGFDKCETSRLASRKMDNCKVDLTGLPVLLQVKAGSQKRLDVPTVLEQMQDSIDEHFPHMSDYPKAVVRWSRGKRGKKRTPYSQTVEMTMDDYEKLLEMAYINKNATDKRKD